MLMMGGSPATRLAQGGARGLAAVAPQVEKIVAKTPAETAREAGYVLTPAQAESSNPISHSLAAIGGKTKTQQLASVKNQEVTNQLARKELGLSQDAPLDGETFKALRQKAAGAYGAVSQKIPQLQADEAFREGVARLSHRSNELAEEFPGLMDNPK